MKNFLKFITVIGTAALMVFTIFILPIMLVCLLAVILGAIAITLTEFFKSCLVITLIFIGAVIIVTLWFALGDQEFILR